MQKADLQTFLMKHGLVVPHLLFQKDVPAAAIRTIACVKASLTSVTKLNRNLAQKCLRVFPFLFVTPQAKVM